MLKINTTHKLKLILKINKQIKGLNLKPFFFNIPSTGSSTRNLDLELNGKTHKTVEPIKGDMGYVLDVGGPPDFHVMDGGDDLLILAVDAARGHHGFSESR